MRFNIQCFTYIVHILNRRAGMLSQYSNSLRVCGSGDQIPARTRFYAPVQTGPGDHSVPNTMGPRSFPGVKRPGCGLTTHTHLASRWKKESSYASTPLWALMRCSKANFKFTCKFTLLINSKIKIGHVRCCWKFPPTFNNTPTKRISAHLGNLEVSKLLTCVY
jgi:hypothetical protein